MSGAQFNRGGSRQDYETPQALIVAIERRFGPITFDLAASSANAKAPLYFTEEDDSLVQNWAAHTGLHFLNPPFRHIAPWAAKCASEAALGARIAFLVPAAVGSVWFETHVHRRAMVLALQPRLCFDGKHPYPKDCVLCLFGPLGEVPWSPGFDLWRWK